MAPINFIPSSLPSMRASLRHSPSRPCVSPRAVVKMSASSLRIGHGFDLHRLEPGLPLILGGVNLPHDRGCAGHSDGDAVYHCVVDAILGALSLPDIGQLFPDTDPRFKGCASHVFMQAAYEKMTEKGFKVGNIDVTVILERPKMAPHKGTIRENIAGLLHTPLENVNLKAKTHEKVDALGENRAVSVHAVAMLVPLEGGKEEQRGDARSSKRNDGARAVTQRLLDVVGEQIEDMSGRRGSGCALEKLYNTVMSRKNGDVESSWTAKLFAKGRGKICQKVGEEAVEVVLDGSAGNVEGVVKESADLLYHLSVLWADMGVTPGDVWAELERREGTSGITEKASRTEGAGA
eukprot:GFKZ01006435.1.p1 GENE.GFKZ01006435.1~~GFKZ01006435.1.p1  ORF type:complete len:349 (-),score=66.46 GFKZ01006435.1:1229-2275(-)